MSLVENLTIEITGDSRQFQNEISGVVDSLTQLEELCSQVAENADAMNGSMSGISRVISPLQSISQLLGTITQQIQAVSAVPMNIDVTPALNSLQMVLVTAQAVAQQIAMLSQVGAMSALPVSSRVSALEAPGPARAFASGGLVTGPHGIDQVPARLTAGEYVLNAKAVSQIGVEKLNTLNRSAGKRTSEAFSSSQKGGFTNQSLTNAVNHSTSNHFGGIEIHVRETADVNDFLRTLQHQSTSLKNRRG